MTFHEKYNYICNINFWDLQSKYMYPYSDIVVSLTLDQFLFRTLTTRVNGSLVRWFSLLSV